MEHSATAHRVVRFALFEVDLDSGELRKNGVKLKIQEQPLQILCLLLDRPGEIVTREELQQRLWPDGVFVDFEHGVSTAVKKLREVLGDDANNPRFVETVPRRGYRFIAPANGNESVPTSAPVSDRPGVTRRKVAMFAAVLVLAVVAVSAWRILWSERPGLRIIRSQQVTSTGKVVPITFVETARSIQTDGRRIYYSDSSFRLRYVDVAGGEAELVAANSGPVVLLHISPDGSTLLARQALGPGGASESALWLVPANGGPPRRLGGIEAQDAAWSPDGKTIAFAQGQSLFLTDDQGNKPRKLAATPGRAFWLRWSPDGKRLRFSVKDPKVGTLTLWETTLEGMPHHLLANWKDAGNLCCGIWSPDGRSYLFLNIRNGESQLWSLPEPRFSWARAEPTPVVLSAVGVQIRAVAASPLQKKLFVVGVRPFAEVVALDPVTKRSTQLFPGLALLFASFSPSGKWVAFTQVKNTNYELWRARSDGTDLLQLTTPPLVPVIAPRFSPDDSRIAFMGKFPDQPFKVYWVSADGGGLHELPTDVTNQADPNWSPDGQSIIFGETPPVWAESGKPKAIYVSNLRTKLTSKLPGSDGWFSPRISPDGGFLATLSIDQKRIGLFDFAHSSWRTLIQTDGGANPFWSSDSQWIYYNDHFSNGELWRVRAKDGHKELVFPYRDLLPKADCEPHGFTPNQSVIFACSHNNSDIYALDWE